MIRIKLFAIIFTVTMLFSVSNSFGQDAPHSLGLAPQSDVKVFNEPNPFAIGTRAFTQISTTPTFQFGKSFLESCTITNVGSPFLITFPGGLVYKDGVVYTWNQSSPFQLWTIDTVTGVHTFVFNMTGPPLGNFTGMCWDGTTMYGIGTSITQSQIFTINMTTGVCTLIGSPSAVCAGAINLLGRLGTQYSLFVVDIVLDNLYRVNKTTGVFTLVGALGANANFGQDGTVDPADNAFYWMAYTTGPQLRKLDTTNGSSVLLCSYLAQATGIAAKGAAGPPPPLTACRNVNVPILDNSTARDSVFVNLGGCTITDVNVRIDTVLHSWDSDLRFYIQRGTVGALVISNVGGSGDNFIGTILDDEATTPIASGTPPFTGSFIPSNPLTPFDGAGSSVYWKIAITDTAGGDEGILKAWCLVISYNCPTGGVKTIEVPNYYFLNQNYPNPFNPTTTIKFGVPETENVKLVIYDILGREVRTLLNEVRTPGTYEVNFDATNLASGIYFYNIQTPNFTQTKRMLLVK